MAEEDPKPQEPQKVDWKIYLDKVDAILEKKGQPKLTRNEGQNLVNNWQQILMSPQGAMILQMPDPIKKQLMESLNRHLANATYDVLKASRGDSYK